MRVLDLFICFCCLLSVACSSSPQQEQQVKHSVIVSQISQNGEIRLSEEISIPQIDRGYTLWLPEKEAKGLVFFTHPRKDTVNSDELIDHALKNNLAVMYATTNNQLEFFFEIEKMQEIESYLEEVIRNHGIPAKNILFCGMSLEGTRALKLAAFSKSDSSKYHLVPKAIAICDAPLDMIRFHGEDKRADSLSFNELAANEGKWVAAYLERNLGGSPANRMDQYLSYSPYSFLNKDQKSLEVYRDIQIRAYTEPNINWWIENRRKSYYGMNAIDLAAFINELKLLGHENAELITTEGKGYRENGEYHPHSWSIVNEKELLNWFTHMHDF